MNKQASITLIAQIRALDKLEQNISKLFECGISDVLSRIISDLTSILESEFDFNWTDELYDKLYDRSVPEYELYELLCLLEHEDDL